MHDHDDCERLLSAVAAAVPTVPPSSPDLDRRIMAAVRAAAPSPRRVAWRGALGWFAAPRTITLSPLGIAACTAALVAAALAADRLIHRPAPPAGLAGREPAVAADSAGPSVSARTVRFVLTAPAAASVAVVGDFNQWSPNATPLRPTGVAGVWTVDVTLPTGRHEYAFVIDGTRWVADPAAPHAPVAEFGPPNSVITVTPEFS